MSAPLSRAALCVAGENLCDVDGDAAEAFAWDALTALETPPDALGALAGRWAGAAPSERHALVEAVLQALGAPADRSPATGAVLRVLALLPVQRGPGDDYLALRKIYDIAIAFHEADGPAGAWLWRALSLYWAMTDVVDDGMGWSTLIMEINEANIAEAVAQECAALLADPPPGARAWIAWAEGLA
ncbi:hypothetical protein ACQ5SO_01505 [Rhodovulum sp. DZ06]|uniref:hypothetical protein n=1 Tax=Rhodovulum sp. DZ06 TaxID=3425126 RepID=UPI003D32DAEF